MSENSLPDLLDDPPMEVTVETLTGTVFDIRVYPTETILDIKNKIQRVEGIPVHHQSLLYQMKEMSDYAVLADHGITNGSILKLVLSIRGGPISTRRFTTCDHHIIWRDLKELIENSQAENNEPGSKVSVLVYKDGEVLNVLRVIENEDGSYSPYTDKVEASGQTDPSEASCTILPKSAGESKSGEPSSKASPTETVCADFTCDLGAPAMSPLFAQSPPLTACAGGGGGGHGRSRRELPPPAEDLQQIDTMFLKMAEDVEMANKLHELKRRMRNVRTMRHAKGDASLPHPPPPLHAASPALAAATRTVDDVIDMGLGELALKEKHRTRTHRPAAGGGGYLHNLHVFDPLPAHCEHLDDECGAHPANNRLRMARLALIVQEQQQEMDEAAAAAATATAQPQCKVGLLQRRASLDFDSSDFGLADDPEDLFYRLPAAIPRYASAAPPPATAKYDMNLMARSPLYGRLSRNSNDNFLTPLAQSPSPDLLPDRNGCNIERVQNDYIDYDELDQDVFGYYNAEFDKYIATGIPPPSASIAAASGGVGLDYFRSALDDDYAPTAADEDEHEAAHLANEIKKLTILSDVQVQPPQISVQQQDAPAASAGGGGRKRTTLPAVVAKKRMRCGQCNKRLNITNIYNCRCGLIFCAQHRYSESHECKYDYKAEGRKLIEQQNPLVTASKVTKF